MTTHLHLTPSPPHLLLEGKRENFFEKDWYDWKLALKKAGILREKAGKGGNFPAGVLGVVPTKFPLTPGFSCQIPALYFAFFQ